MGTHMGHVFTLANSIIGVSVLAMPFCFRQCGIVLSVLMLLLSSYISRLACHYLMKSAIMERMKNFEMLAFRAFGPTGKTVVEMSIVGFMLGTCVAFFVIIGDLGPDILGPILGLEHPTAIRPSVLIGTAIFVVLPLGLLKNVDSLNGICAASLAFYGVLVLKVFLESAINLFGTDVWSSVYYWRPLGILRCIPIFSMALSCQTQLFEIFGSLPSTPLDRANGVVKSAVSLTTFLYIAVGFFGYVAYANTLLTGNVMMNFSPGASSDMIKICFLLSVAVTFPLVIFPCRASIYSFLYSKHSYEGFGSAHIPETRFQCITLVIVTSSLIIGLLIPNIELVLGLVGSTLGVFICVITPGLIFTTLSSKRNNERLLAQILVGAGLVIMVLGTYANLFATEEALVAPDTKEEVEIIASDEKKELHLPIADLNRDVEQMQKVLEKLKQEEEARKELRKNVQKDEIKGNVENAKNASPGVIFDHNPQPLKLDEGPKPQPVAPEPPEEPQKKIPMVIPESLQHLEGPKKLEETKADQPIVLPEKVKPAPIIDKVKKEFDPIHPVPPVDLPKQASLEKEQVPHQGIIGPVVEAESKKIVEPKSERKLNVTLPEEKIDGAQKTMKSLDHDVIKAEDKVEADKSLDNQPIGNLSLSIKRGLPLPLAIKELDEIKTNNLSNEASKNRVESREKRDLQSDISIDEDTSVKSEINVKNSIVLGSSPLEGVDNVVNDPTVHEKENINERGELHIVKETNNATSSLSELKPSVDKSRQLKYPYDSGKEEKERQMEHKEEGEDDECPKMTAKKEVVKQETTTSIIKTPGKLANGEAILPIAQSLPQMPEPQLSIIHDHRLGKQKK